MPYIPHTPDDRRAMLEAIGVGSIDELLAMVPGDLQRTSPLDVPPALGEMELSSHMAELANRNTPAGQSRSFLGAGVYDHFIPAVVDYVASRSEFYTAYTPYQAEASQGTLQAVFEYQTLVTQLTGMDVSNASLYDGATAAVEAVLAAMHATGRSGRVVAAGGLHPEYRQTLAAYLADFETETVVVASPDGGVSLESLEQAVDAKTACVIVQHPNFFGCLEDVKRIAAIAHRAGAVFIVVFDPISLGVLARPGDYGADIAVAEGQALGIPMSFGGPGLGIMACREQFVRRMPGRLVGQTLDRRGKRCWVLTLQTREQHIRREKATSNICSNQALMALRAAVYLAAMGPAGMRQVAELCVRKAGYAKERLAAVPGLSIAFARPTFKEFTVRVADRDAARRLDAACRRGVFAGVALGRWYPELSDCFLTAVTEKRTKGDIDALAEAIG